MQPLGFIPPSMTTVPPLPPLPALAPTSLSLPSSPSAVTTQEGPAVRLYLRLLAASACALICSGSTKATIARTIIESFDMGFSVNWFN